MRTNRIQQKNQNERNALGLALLALGNTIHNTIQTMTNALVRPMQAACGQIAGQACVFGGPVLSHPGYRSESVMERSFSRSDWFTRSSTASTGGAIPVARGAP